MKRLFKKNQIIITTLAIMIAVAGYLNYSGKIFGNKETAKETNNELASKELLDISEEDTKASEGDIKSQDQEVADVDTTVDGTPGEAVLTSTEVSTVVAKAKVTREQVRAKNKETLQGIIDSKNLSEEQKQDAVNQIVGMTETAEKEAAAETLLASKGFDDAVVTLSKESVDVVVNGENLSDASRAQIEDVIARKTGMAPEQIVINPIHAQSAGK
ncbi:MAG: SpoIIIAH-like family protein [Lachnospiraceae bacterium]